MKTAPVFAFAAAALGVGLLAAWWCAGQTSNQPSTKEPSSYDFGALQQYESFVSYLQDTKQTNILQRFEDYSNASLALQHCADLGMTLIILKSLREGRSNQVYQLLETRLDADVVAFANSYRRLPASLQEQEQSSLKALRGARDYRAKYSSPPNVQVVNDAVADAFKLLDGK